MNLYLLKPINPDAGPWDPWYDRAFGFVVRAKSPTMARKIADENAGDENRIAGHPWLYPAMSSCKVLRADGPEGLILQDTHAA